MAGGAKHLIPPLPSGLPASESTVFGGCLVVVTRLAKRLPIRRTVPKQHVIALVRDDVIDHRGSDHFTLVLMQLAQRMLTQPASSGALPCAGVPTLVGTASLDVLRLLHLLLVGDTPTRAIPHQGLASGVGAGTWRGDGHKRRSPTDQVTCRASVGCGLGTACLKCATKVYVVNQLSSRLNSFACATVAGSSLPASMQTTRSAHGLLVTSVL